MAENYTDSIDDRDETCARKTLGPWLAATAILLCGAVALAIYHAEDIRKAQDDRSSDASATAMQSPRMGVMRAIPAKQTAFVPPWRSDQAVDAVTAPTPRRASFNRTIEIVSPSVVGINTTGVKGQGGSGIIVHHSGYIITNYHVVKGARNIVVTLVYDQLFKSYPGELVDSRADLDLALIKISPRNGELFSPAPLGDSDQIYIGQDVVAIGNPFGLTQSASAGIISNTRRSLTAGDKVFRDLIQTDASINPGSSGGALVNARAEVIGVSTAIYSPVQGFTGVGFAIPINQAKAVFGRSIESIQSPLVRGVAQAGKRNANRDVFPPMGANLQMMAGPPARVAQRCWVGIDVRRVNPVVAREFRLPLHNGVLVNRVFDGSPAAVAGLRRGDIIYRVNNRRVRNAAMAWAFLTSGRPGDKVKVTLFRSGVRKSVTLRLEPEPANIRAILSPGPQAEGLGVAPETTIEEISWLGVDIQPLEAGEATQEFGVNPNQKGVFVGEVEGIAAIEAGLMAGDVIKSVNNRRVNDIEAFKDVIKRIDPSRGVLLDVARKNRRSYITIQPSKWDRGAWQ